MSYLRQLHKNTHSDIVLVAYRGFSDSNGEPSESGLQLDAEAIIDYAITYSKKNHKDLYVLGRSLGGAVSIYITSQ